MKKKIKAGSALLCFILAFVLALHFVTGLLMTGKTGVSKNIRDFYKIEENSLDVLILGDSSTYRSMNPALLWHEGKLTSYVLGAPQARVYALSYLLEDAFKRQSPKVVVLEVNAMFEDHPYSVGNMRKIIDHMPLSKNKIKMIFDPTFHFDNTQKLSLLMPITFYKNRYQEITKKEFENYLHPSKETLNGYVFSDKIKAYTGRSDYMMKEEDCKLSDVSIAYLEKIKALCDEHHASLVLVKVPGAREWNKSKKESIVHLANTLSLPYLDMNDHTIDAIHWNEDTNDKGVHLNVYGSMKVTSTLLAYLREQYVFDHQHSKEVEAKYHHIYEYFVSKLINNKDVV